MKRQKLLLLIRRLLLLKTVALIRSFTLTAVDSDDVSSGISFALSGDDAEAFTISNEEGTFGQVTLLDNPDADVKSQYNFTVVVSDGVQDVEQNVTLDINNVDDTNPEITSSDMR